MDMITSSRPNCYLAYVLALEKKKKKQEKETWRWIAKEKEAKAKPQVFGPRVDDGVVYDYRVFQAQNCTAWHVGYSK